jgi:hypothetical protein
VSTEQPAELSAAKRALLERYLRGGVKPLASTKTLDREAQLPPAEPDPAPIKATTVYDGGRVVIRSLRTSGTRRPFFYLHGDWNLRALHCFALAHDLGADQPFYLVDPYSFIDLKIIPSIEQIAAENLTGIRAIQPHGPYVLGGFCNGALIACEIAHQLQDAGETVETLVLVDPWASGYPQRLTQMIGVCGRLIHVGVGRQIDWFLRIRHLYKKLQLSQKRRAEDRIFLDDLDPSLHSFLPPAAALRLDYPGLFTWSSSLYRFRPIAGRVTILWDAEESFLHDLWHTFILKTGDTVRESYVPGSHHTMRSDHVHEFAAALRDCLEVSEQASGSPREA